MDVYALRRRSDRNRAMASGAEDLRAEEKKVGLQAQDGRASGAFQLNGLRCDRKGLVRRSAARQAGTERILERNHVVWVHRYSSCGKLRAHGQEGPAAESRALRARRPFCRTSSVNPRTKSRIPATINPARAARKNPGAWGTARSPVRKRGNRPGFPVAASPARKKQRTATSIRWRGRRSAGRYCWDQTSLKRRRGTKGSEGPEGRRALAFGAMSITNPPPNRPETRTEVRALLSTESF